MGRAALLRPAAGLDQASPKACGTYAVEPEDRHRLCWYSRRTRQIPPDLGVQTIVDGELLYCAHPMLFPIVGFEFAVRNCLTCDYFKARRTGNAPTSPVY